MSGFHEICNRHGGGATPSSARLHSERRSANFARTLRRVSCPKLMWPYRLMREEQGFLCGVHSGVLFVCADKLMAMSTTKCTCQTEGRQDWGAIAI